MKHIKLFNEEVDHLDRLKRQKEIDDEYYRTRDKEIEDSRYNSNELSKIKSENKNKRSTEDRESERKEIVQVVLDSLIYSNLKKPGFENFEEDIKMFLSEYPLEKLPKSGDFEIFKK